MTDDVSTNIKASRMRVARSRGALSGVLVVILGAWAALVPFIGTYLHLKTTPSPDSAWKWTAARGWLEVLPGAVAVVGGLLLLLSAHRAVTSFGGWLAAAAGAWLVVGPPLGRVLDLTPSTPDPAYGKNAAALTSLLTFFALGAAILLFAALALGRLSVHGLGDVRAAEKRARRDAEREVAERETAEREAAEHRAATAAPSAAAAPAAVDERPRDEFADYRTAPTPQRPTTQSASATQDAPSTQRSTVGPDGQRPAEQPGVEHAPQHRG